MTPGGAASTPEDEAAAEAAVAELLTWPAPSGRPLDGGQLSWFHLPFTELGRDKGLDLSWETQVQRGSGGPATTEQEISGGATLSEGLQAHVSSLRELPLDEDAALRWTAAARALERRWAGWSELLRQATAVAASAPASAEEPSEASVDMDVRWDDQASEPGWAWTVSVPIVDTEGQEVGFREWPGSSPAEALRAALADADEWYRPVPAWPSTSSDGGRPWTMRRTGLTWAAGLLGAGLVTVLAYVVLAATTSIGDVGDIGGGLVLLTGYLLAGAGVVTGVVVLIVERGG